MSPVDCASLRSVALRDQVNELLYEGHRDFVLNLAGVPYIDSFGLGQLVSIWTSIRSQKGELVLLQPTDHVQQLLELTKLNTVFHILREEAQAVTSARTSFTFVSNFTRERSAGGHG